MEGEHSYLDGKLRLPTRLDAQSKLHTSSSSPNDNDLPYNEHGQQGMRTSEHWPLTAPGWACQHPDSKWQLPQPRSFEAGLQRTSNATLGGSVWWGHGGLRESPGARVPLMGLVVIA